MLTRMEVVDPLADQLKGRHPMEQCVTLRGMGRDVDAGKVLVRYIGQAGGHERSGWLLVAALLFFQNNEFALCRRMIGRVDPRMLDPHGDLGIGKSARELFDFLLTQSRRIKAACRKLSREYSRKLAAA